MQVRAHRLASLFIPFNTIQDVIRRCEARIPGLEVMKLMEEQVTMSFKHIRTDGGGEDISIESDLGGWGRDFLHLKRRVLQ